MHGGCACGGRAGPGGQTGGRDGAHCRCGHPGLPRHPAEPHPAERTPAELHPAALARLHDTLLQHATAMLSGPDGLASFLRIHLTGARFPSVSLPLDTGTPANPITRGLRRAVPARDRHCASRAATTASRPPARCTTSSEKAQGRAETRLGNLILLCAFHHLIAVQPMGLVHHPAHPTGTITAVSPDGTRTLHSHGPPPPNPQHSDAVRAPSRPGLRRHPEGPPPPPPPPPPPGPIGPPEQRHSGSVRRASPGAACVRRPRPAKSRASPRGGLSQSSPSWSGTWS